MNETTKKVVLGVIVVAGLGFAIYEGIGLVKEPSLTPAVTIGHGTPGHGMKAAEKEEAAGPGAAGSQTSGGDLGGPAPSK